MKQKLLFSLLAFGFTLASLAQAICYPPLDMYQCDSEVFNLLTQTPVVLGNQNPQQFSVGFYASYAAAVGQTNAVSNPANFVGSQNQAVFVRVSSLVDASFAIGTFFVNWNFTPVVQPMADVLACNSYFLPALTVGNYYALPNGTAPLNSSIITNSQTVYVYASNGNCTDETSFHVTIIGSAQDQMPDVTACGSYILPVLPVQGSYFTGPNGTGMALAPGTEITLPGTYYFYTTNGICSSDSTFMVTIVPQPVITYQPPADVYVCPGQAQVLEVVATGANLTYQWYFNAMPISGANSSVYTALDYEGTYSCLVSGNNCSAQTNGTYVHVGTVDLSVSSQSPGMICPGSSFTITANSGSAPQAYTWYKDGVELGNTSDSYTVNVATFSDSGHYSCVMSGTACGNFTVTIQISIGGPAPFFEPMTSCFNANGIATFDLTSLLPQAIPPPAYYYFYENLADAQNFTPNNIPADQLAQYQSTTSYKNIYIRLDNLIGSQCDALATVTLIGQQCSGNQIAGVVKFDYDNNGCSGNDYKASSIQVSNTFGNTVQYTYTNPFGEYTFTNIQEGSNFVMPVGLPAGFNVSAPASYQFNVTGNNAMEQANFCLTTPTAVTDATTYFWAQSGARPGFQASYVLYVYNSGTVSLSGNATLTFDTSKLDFTTAFPAQASLNGNTLQFQVDNLAPFQYKIIQIHFMVKTPPTVNAGDTLGFNAAMATALADITPADNVAVLNQTVVNSYDPNEITVQQGAQILQSQVADYLDYTIHFQNTGSADAVNVRLENALDAKLDWATFRPVASSHNYTAERTGNQVTFTFDNIYLPASAQNEAGSNGYITYRVKPKATLAIGDVISNQAQIYFDFNPAIATNTVTTQLVTVLGTAPSVFSQLKVFPNPAKSKVTILVENSGAKISASLYDLQGKRILAEENQQQPGKIDLDVSQVQAGIYLLRIVSGNTAEVRKLVIE